MSPLLPPSSRSLALLAALAASSGLACDPAHELDDPSEAFDSEGTDTDDETGDLASLGDAAPDELQAEPDVAEAHDYAIHSWQQGQAPVPMGNVIDKYCFLTEVAGHFGSGYERARVYEYQGKWWLGGMGFTADGIRAKAVCIPRYYYGVPLFVSEEYVWRQEAPYTDMGPAAGRVCMLTHVQGDFNGEGDSVEAYPTLGPDGRWWLGGSSSNVNGGVAAAARCVNITPSWLNGPFNWVKPYWVNGFPTTMKSAASYTCGLTMVRGAFDAWAERVGAYVNGSNTWVLHGGTWPTDFAVSVGTWATAYCF